MTDTAPSRTKRPIWQMDYLPVALDGKEFIAVHPKAKTELGRLLHGNALTPFTVYGLDNPKEEGGAWPSFYAAAATLDDAWVKHFDVEVPAFRVCEKLTMWYRWRLEQNLYIKDLLLGTILPIVFVHDEVGELNKSPAYKRLICHEWLQTNLHKQRHAWKQHEKKLEKIRKKH